MNYIYKSSIIHLTKMNYFFSFFDSKYKQTAKVTEIMTIVTTMPIAFEDEDANKCMMLF